MKDCMFQFTCPSRSTTLRDLWNNKTLRFQFTCPSRSTTDADYQGYYRRQVSIHVPLAEHDGLGLLLLLCLLVSIHVPLAEHDRSKAMPLPLTFGFNSRAPRGARHAANIIEDEAEKFQFTCPSRSTTCCTSATISAPTFQFTCPSRSTTF